MTPALTARLGYVAGYRAGRDARAPLRERLRRLADALEPTDADARLYRFAWEQGWADARDGKEPTR